MPEFWFKYGVTEVSLEVPEEVNYEHIGFEQSRLSEDLWRRLTDFAEKLCQEAGSRPVTILYDHLGENLLPAILKHLLESLNEGGVREIRLLTSYWMLDPRSGREHLAKCLKEHGIALKPIEPGECDMVSLGEISVAREISESALTIILADITPHGLLGKASIREALALGGFIKQDSQADLKHYIHASWDILVSKLPLYAIAAYDKEVFMGDAREVSRKIDKLDLTRVVEDYEVVIAGCGGYPKDSSLQSIAHTIGMLKDSVMDEGMIGIIAECKNGLGSTSFIEALLAKGGSPLEKALANLMRDVLSEKRIAFVSALPKSILKNLLGVRGFDIPQDLLVYALRIYSKNAKLLILDEPRVKPVRRATLSQSSRLS